MTEPIYESDKWELEERLNELETLLRDTEKRVDKLIQGLKDATWGI